MLKTAIVETASGLVRCVVDHAAGANPLDNRPDLDPAAVTLVTIDKTSPVERDWVYDSEAGQFLPPPGPSLDESKDALVARLWADIDGFIQRKPSGRPRYDHNFQAAANALDKTAMTAEQLAKYQAVFSWVDAVWSEVYYQTKGAMDAAETLSALEAISWDLSPYEVDSGESTADPDISLTELRS